MGQWHSGPCRLWQDRKGPLPYLLDSEKRVVRTAQLTVIEPDDDAAIGAGFGIGRRCYWCRECRGRQ